MLQFTDAQLLGWIAAWFWPFCRIGALFITAPILQDRSIPQPVKIALAAMIAGVIAPGVQVPTEMAIFSVEGLLLLVHQLIIGASLGLTMRLVFAGVELCGNLIGLQMGLGFALFFDPEHNTQTPVIGSLLGFLTTLIFLALNGHLMMITAVTESFQTLPMNHGLQLAVDWHSLVLHGSTVFSIGLHLALPVLATLLLTNVAMGVLTRAAPQLNLFSIGFPLTLLIGLAALALAMPYMEPLIERYLNEAIQQLGR
jgi:flagellar biosynthetic protein FliR